MLMMIFMAKKTHLNRDPPTYKSMLYTWKNSQKNVPHNKSLEKIPKKLKSLLYFFFCIRKERFFPRIYFLIFCSRQHLASQNQSLATPTHPPFSFADIILEWSLTLFESTELTLVRRGLTGILEKAEFLVPCSA